MRAGRFAAATALPLAALLLSVPAAPASAQDDPQAERQLDEAGRLALRAAEKMLGALQLFIDDLPSYAPPEVLPNGDILIRRLNPKDGGEGEGGGEREIETDTLPPPDPPTRDALRPEGQPIPPSERNPDAAGGERRI